MHAGLHGHKGFVPQTWLLLLAMLAWRLQDWSSQQLWHPGHAVQAASSFRCDAGWSAKIAMRSGAAACLRTTAGASYRQPASMPQFTLSTGL